MALEILAGYLISLVTLVLVFKAGTNGVNEPATSTYSIRVALLFLLLGAYPRLYHMASTSYGLMLFEELSAVTYMEQMLSGKPTYAGATQMVFFLIMDAWRFLFGMSAYFARGLSALFGLGSLLVFFLALRRLLPSGAAWLATGLMAMSLYAGFFSRLAIEPGWSLFFFALNLYLFARVSEGQRGFFLLGLSIALGVFTYPGYTLWLICVLPILLFMAQRKRLVSLGQVGWIAIGFSIFTVPTVIFHYLTQSHAPLFRGGGVWFEGSHSYVDSLRIHFQDIFVTADSYYLVFNKDTFLETSLFAFFGIGAWALVKRERRTWAAVLLGSAILLPFLSSTATNHPGMRRAIILLPIFYIFSGAGMNWIIQKFANSALLWRALSLFVVISAGLIPFKVVVDGVHEAATAAPFDRYSEVIQHPNFMTWLKSERVRLIMDQPQKFQAEYITSFVRLAERYRGVKGDFKIYTPPDSILVTLLQPGQKEIWIFSNLELANQWLASGRACLKNTEKLTTHYFPFFVTEIQAPLSGLPCH